MISMRKYDEAENLNVDWLTYLLEHRVIQDHKAKDYISLMNQFQNICDLSEQNYKEWVKAFSGWKIHRYDIINHLIKKFNYLNYLEIGIYDGTCFNKIDVEHKDGVDPNPAGDGIKFTNYLITSDDFFKLIEGEDIKYDIIFIDGLHHDYQVYADIKNSLKHIVDGGTIVCHDMNPLFEVVQFKRAVLGGTWNGDCWKAWVKLRTENSDLEMCVIDTDNGVGIIRKGYQKLFELPEGKKLLNPQDGSATFKLLNDYRNELLNLISVEDFYKKYKI